MKKSVLLLISFSALIASVGITSCDAGKNKTGRAYMPDMTYSTAYEAYGENRVVDSLNNAISYSASSRNPDARSIPHGYLPENPTERQNESHMRSWVFKNHYANWNFNPQQYQALYDAAGAELKNPLTATPAHLEAGKKVYNIQCAVCHGDKGAGDGSIVVAKDAQGNAIGDGPYTAIPPKYTDRLPGLSDGNLFYSVSFGKNMMGGYAHALNVEQRWQVILYIKELAGLNNAPAAPASQENVEAVAPASAMAH